MITAKTPEDDAFKRGALIYHSSFFGQTVEYHEPQFLRAPAISGPSRLTALGVNKKAFSCEPRLHSSMVVRQSRG